MVQPPPPPQHHTHTHNTHTHTHIQDPNCQQMSHLLWQDYEYLVVHINRVLFRRPDDLERFFLNNKLPVFQDVVDDTTSVLNCCQHVRRGDAELPTELHQRVFGLVNGCAVVAAHSQWHTTEPNRHRPFLFFRGEGSFRCQKQLRYARRTFWDARTRLWPSLHRHFGSIHLHLRLVRWPMVLLQRSSTSPSIFASPTCTALVSVPIRRSCSSPQPPSHSYIGGRG